MTGPPDGSFRTLGAIFGTRLLAVFNTLRIEHAAKDMITNAGKIANTSATDQDNTMLLKIVAFARNIGNDLALVGQANLGNFAKSRVWLFRGRGINACANAALLRVSLHRGNFGLRLLRSPALADQLVNRWHIAYRPVARNGARWRLSRGSTRSNIQCAVCSFPRNKGREESHRLSCGVGPLAGAGVGVKSANRG